MTQEWQWKLVPAYVLELRIDGKRWPTPGIGDLPIIPDADCTPEELRDAAIAGVEGLIDYMHTKNGVVDGEHFIFEGGKMRRVVRVGGSI